MIMRIASSPPGPPDTPTMRTERVSSAAGGSVTEYLVDKNRQYAQVLEENDSGSLTASYVYGDDLISRKQDGEIRYYIYDGHGSVSQVGCVSP